METPSGPIDINEAARFLLDRQLEQESKDNPDQAQVEKRATDEAGAIDAPAVEDREAEDTSDEELSLTNDAETEELSEEADDEELVEEPVYAVKVDGEEHEVHLDELLKGYSRTANYTRKSQKLSQDRGALDEDQGALLNERNAFDAERNALAQERSQYAELLPGLRKRIELMDSEEPDWDALLAQDPGNETKVLLAQRQFDQQQKARKDQLSAVDSELERLRKAEADEYQKKIGDYVAAGRAKLRRDIPGWSEDTVYQKEAEEISRYLLNKGVSEQEIAALIRPEFIEMARNSMLYERGVKRYQKTRKKASTDKTVVRPGSAKSTKKPSSVRKKRSYQKLQKTGKLDDAVDLMEQLL